jgi:DNA-directed RNA polymerase specialized sigma24 family protein
MAATTIGENDRVLMSRLMRGDEEAFAEFFEGSIGPLSQLARERTRGDESAADAAVRRTLVEAVRNLDSWRGRTSVQSWLATIYADAARSVSAADDSAGSIRETVHREWQAVTTRRAQKRVLTSLAFAILLGTIILLFNCPG